MSASLRQPFQCILYIKRRLAGLHNLLVAASGPRLYTYAPQTGRRLFVWPHGLEDKNENVLEDQGPPAKGTNASLMGNGANETKSSAVESRASQPEVAWSHILLLTSTTNGSHLVIVTEDKNVRVLQLGKDGTLEQLSSR